MNLIANRASQFYQTNDISMENNLEIDSKVEVNLHT